MLVLFHLPTHCVSGVAEFIGPDIEVISPGFVVCQNGNMSSLNTVWYNCP